MKKLEYRVTFITPAFLGDADQQAQWRTPPFKALLRQWWRVVHAPTVNFDSTDLRRDEGRIFGVAADGGESRRSLVQLRLSSWAHGCTKEWHPDSPLTHPETDIPKIGAELYLGFGPLTRGDTGKKTKDGKPIKGTAIASIKGDPEKRLRTAIADGNMQQLTIMVPEKHREEMRCALNLAAWFGTAGSRARNGWGALQVEALADTPSIATLTAPGLAGVLRPLDKCLNLDWPHAIGMDQNGPLVWNTQATDSWREAMKELARIKIAFRTHPTLSLAGVPAGQFSSRHLLGYPVTHHAVTSNGWGNQGRLANQLRFKVAKHDGKWHGVIVHLPCRLPAEMVEALPSQQRNNIDAMAHRTWRAVHTVLDENANRLL